MYCIEFLILPDPSIPSSVLSLTFKHRTDVASAYPGLALSVMRRRKPTDRVAILVDSKDGLSIPASDVASAMQVPHSDPLHPLGLAHVHPLVPLFPLIVGSAAF